jgi:hypothetical protein
MDNLSPLQPFDETQHSLESSAPPSYGTSSFRPTTKQEKLEAGHQNSISDRHQHKRYMITDSPPSEKERPISEEEEIPSTGT